MGEGTRPDAAHAYGRVQECWGGWSSQPTTRERRRQECDEGLRPEGTAFSGRPCEVGSVGAGRGRGMHDAGLSMCFTGRAE